MMKSVTINKSIIEERKWTPKFAYIYKKLESSPAAIKLEDFIIGKPINGIDLRDFIEAGRNYVRVSDMKRFFISYSDIKKVKLDKIPKKVLLRERDILISRKGTPGIAVITTQEDIDNIIGTEAILLRIKKEYDPYYLVAFFNSKIFFEQVLNNLSGAVASGINHPSLKQLKIVYNKDLIQTISDKVKNATHLQVEAKKVFSKAERFFYEKLDIDFSKIKKENFYSVNLSDFLKADLWTPAYSFPLYVNTLKAIQNKCQTIPLDQIATTKNGDEIGSDNYSKYLDKKDEDVPFIRTSDLVNYEADQFPDFYVHEEIYQKLDQDIKTGDVLFTKDGKIGMTAMITKNDKIIIASGVTRLRLKEEAKKYHITPEYLFLVLSLEETGFYPATRRTVIASTLPHLRKERLEEFEIPILDKNAIDIITEFIKKVFWLKDKKKKFIKEVKNEIDSCFGL